ncbi:helix-turn-helix domain-containing protein [Fervidibacillus albus]|uniref:Helix-turn-helix domain-containing protein n=1 Tax=Fervidibacillus albus TaxID=2980026 RepID=A0A9E8RWQ0_9BACI|nr:helix-turn-helix domain-containing protein [Fervidibacillus albus]WAA10529.1 helix-turn-helix domain-containing protein [Fervidibacillus albus]
MNYSHALILHCIRSFCGERSANAAFYLLKGKKSAQTIQDASWYSLRHFFAALPELSKDEFDRIVEQFLRQGWIIWKEHGAYITEPGKDWLDETLATKPLPPFFDGWKYGGVESLFWKRISLLIQTISYWARFQTDFLPVQRDLSVQFWVKDWLNRRKASSREQIATEFYNELHDILSSIKISGMDPNIFVYRLSGFETTGFTAEQAATRLAIDETYYSLFFRGIIHYMIDSAWKDMERFRYISSIVEKGHDTVCLTKSSLYTYRLIRGGKSMEEIARLRKLKRSTIEDHLVEIASMDSQFSIDDYVPVQLQRKIIVVADALQTRKLKKIKEALNEVDYFSIRLVLSKVDEIRKRFLPSE